MHLFSNYRLQAQVSKIRFSKALYWLRVFLPNSLSPSMP